MKQKDKGEQFSKWCVLFNRHHLNFNVPNAYKEIKPGWHK